MTTKDMERINKKKYMEEKEYVGGRWTSSTTSMKVTRSAGTVTWAAQHTITKAWTQKSNCSRYIENSKQPPKFEPLNARPNCLEIVRLPKLWVSI